MSGETVERIPETELSPKEEAERNEMENWLDNHPEFVHDYFARKATRGMIDGWLINHALNQNAMPRCMTQSAYETGSNGSNSRSTSGANTPVRKISAQEFERSVMPLKPMISTVEGIPTFIGPILSTEEAASKTLRKTRSELKALDERELIFELVIDICNDLEVTSLCYKILQNVGFIVNADRCSLFLVQKVGGERFLVSKLFDVSTESTLEGCVDKTEEIRIPWGMGIVGHVAKTGERVNIPDAYQDHRFNDEVDIKTGYKTRSILCMPIKDANGDVIGVAQAINKNSLVEEPFDEKDEKVFGSYLAFCGIGLRNAQLYERSQLENKRNQVLLDLARVIFEEQSNVANLIHKIMMHTQSLLQCERCQVLLVDETSKSNSKSYSKRRRSKEAYSYFPQPLTPANKENTHNLKNCKSKMGVFSQVYDLQASDFDNDASCNRGASSEPRFPINIGVTGYVATTGEILNIPDAYKDDRFDPSVDKETDFKTKCIMCLPIKNAQGQIIGVSQLINKIDGSTFNNNDQNLFEAFAIFCGLGINNTQMYEKAVRAMAKKRIAIDVMSYHAIAPIEEANKLKKMPIPSAHYYRLNEYTFSDFNLDDDHTLKATIRMFLDLDLIEKFHISYDMMCRWLLSVKKNYRPVLYHNWRHAFNVAQTMYCIIKQDNMRSSLTDLEILALLVACLCHDLDHRGTNNQFQIKTMSPLAQLYSTSVMEHHHFDQCIMILSTKGTEILSNLSQDQYEHAIKILEGAILATDLALYFRYRGEFFNMVNSGQADWANDEHRELLRSMMMTACDVSAISKPWDVQKNVAKLVADEFFEQGDREKEELKIKPVDMMDRDKKDRLPEMQVGFIDSICLPVYQALVKVCHTTEPLLKGCKDNRENWTNEMRRYNKLKEEHNQENNNKREGDQEL